MRRRGALALGLAVGLVAAACGGADEPGDVVVAPADGSSTTQVGPDPAPSSSVVPAEPAAPVDPGSPSASPSPGGGAGPSPGGGTAPDTPPDALAPPLGAVGSYGPFVLGSASTRVVVEVTAQDGAAPAGGTLRHVESVLGRVASKPIVVDAGGSVGGGGRVWTADAIRDAADAAARTDQGADGAAVLRILFLNGSFEAGDSVLGVAVRSDVAAVFAERVRSASGVLVSRTAVEEAVTVHEIGHLLGLVDLVVDSGREDPEHPGHSPNTGSVMYWAVESDLIGQVLGGGPPRDFDGDDRAELEAIRRRG